VQHLVGQILAGDGRDAGSRRALLQPLRQRFQRVVAPTSKHLDATVIQVLRMTGDAQRQRLLAGAGAKEHALHAAFDKESRRRHQSAPIHCLSKASVTGPSFCCATLPCGSIR